MDIAIAGGHGRIARHLTRLLAGRGDGVRALIRNPDHAADVAADGAQPVVLDLEAVPAEPVADAIRGCDAVVFAAGAGPGSGAGRKETVDYGAAAKLVAAAEAAGVGRYVMISAMGTDDPPDGDDVFSVYLRAKARADDELMRSRLDWTVVRPGRLTDDAATGAVTAARHVQRGAIPRADVAAVIVAVLDRPQTAGVVFELVGGASLVDQAVANLTT
jgi:uncharacterized protein YbjT (DUF2867 family)